jgi:hypothetical protein
MWIFDPGLGIENRESNITICQQDRAAVIGVIEVSDVSIDLRLVGVPLRQDAAVQLHPHEHAVAKVVLPAHP